MTSLSIQANAGGNLIVTAATVAGRLPCIGIRNSYEGEYVASSVRQNIFYSAEHILINKLFLSPDEVVATQGVSSIGNPDGLGDGGNGSEECMEMLNKFLAKNDAIISSISQETTTAEDVLKGVGVPLRFSQFVALHDTLMYSKLIEQVLHYVPTNEQRKLIDLGAGSSVPTIRALKLHPEYKKIVVDAVDVDDAALQIGHDNAHVAGMADRYSFSQQDMGSYMAGLESSKAHIFITNPPYMPIPPDRGDHFLLPVNGGPDGTKYLEMILRAEMKPGTLLGIRWCSLTNPLKMINLIEGDFEVLYVDAQNAPYGTYAKMISEYLEELHQCGTICLKRDSNGNRSFMFIGCVLRRKQ